MRVIDNMATIMLKIMLSISKSMPRCYAFTRLSAAASSFSTAYERAEGSNAVAQAEGRNDDDGMYETRQQDLGMSKDPARDGAIKAVDEADMVRGTAKETMDGAWKASQQTAASHNHNQDTATDDY